MRFFKTLSAVPFSLMAGAAAAQDGITGLETLGKPKDMGIGFQAPATELMRDIIFLDNLLLWIITIISVFVTLLLAYACFRFARKRNPVPAGFTHHSTLEVMWTIIPVFILVFIGAFSLPVLFKQQEIPQADITIKATGLQWYWEYQYVDEGFGFESRLLGSAPTLDEDIRPEDANVTPGINDEHMRAKMVDAGYNADEYLLATDNALVIPVGKTVVIQVTGADVIHAWAVPAFGVKQDGVPGRIAELWFPAEKEGIFFGQCSELCGKDHAYMPITVKVVSEEVYAAWLIRAKEKFAGIAPVADQSIRLASN